MFVVVLLENYTKQNKNYTIHIKMKNIKHYTNLNYSIDMEIIPHKWKIMQSESIIYNSDANYTKQIILFQIF